MIVAGNEARIIAIERFLTTGDLPERTHASVRSEADNHRRAAREHRAVVADLLQNIEALRLRASVGDGAIEQASAWQREYAALARRELDLLGSAAGPEVSRLVRRVLDLSSRLDAREREVEEVAAERIALVRATLDEEIERLTELTGALAGLTREAEDVVGFVAHQTFLAVRARFHDLVIRTDVGQIDIAWAIREEHRQRVEQLTRGRAREIQALDAEFREISDEGTKQGGRR